MFTVALPLTAATCAFSLVYAVALRSKRIYKLYKLSLFIILAGIFTLCVEVILNDAFGHALMLRWSHFVIIPCAVVSIILVIVGSQKRVRDELKKRLFM